jgi:diacylglycerol kinase (ATP)
MEVPQPFEAALESGRAVSLRIYNLLEGESGQKPGFIALREVTLESDCVRVVVGGGDGTIMWAVDEFIKHGIDVQRKLLIGALPLGTGNDFCRCCGWGGRNPRNLLATSFRGERCYRLVRLIKRWTEANPHTHDVWQVVIEVDPDRGRVQRIGDDRKLKTLDSTVIRKPMINYFSLGTDAIGGMDFDRWRPGGQLCNLLTYGAVGCSLVMPCRRDIMHIKELVVGMYRGTDASGQAVFGLGEAQPRLKATDPKGIIVSNINSYAGGTICHMWRNAKRIGVDCPIDPGIGESSSDAGDGRLEVVTTDGVKSMCAQSVGMGRRFIGARKVFSGAPLFFEFHQASELDDTSTVVAHCMIDGEFWRLEHPVSAAVTQHTVLQVLHDHRYRDIAVDHPSSEGEEGSDDGESETDDTVD